MTGQDAPQALVAAQQLAAERGVLPLVGIGLGGQPVHRVGGGRHLVAGDVRGFPFTLPHELAAGHRGQLRGLGDRA
jgi:hypothetical protein